MLKGSPAQIALGGGKLSIQIGEKLIGFGHGDSGLIKLCNKGNNFLIIKYIHYREN